MTTLFGTNSTGANRENRVGRNLSVLSVSSCSNPAVLGIVGPEDTTDISTLKPDITGEDPARRDGVVEIDFNLANSEGVNIYSRRDGDSDFKFLARDTSLAAPKSDEGGPTYVDNRALLVAGKPELREYKAVFVFVVGDIEVSQFSDEITVNCAPLV